MGLSLSAPQCEASCKQRLQDAGVVFRQTASAAERVATAEAVEADGEFDDDLPPLEAISDVEAEPTDESGWKIVMRRSRESAAIAPSANVEQGVCIVCMDE